MPHDLDNLPPSAPRQARRRELHGYAWTDEYAWMSDHDDPRLMDYLRAERAYYDSATGHLANLSNELFGEVRGRLLPTDESVRNRRGAFFYYTRTVVGSEYDQFLSSRDPIAPGRVVLDENDLAAATGDKGGYVAIGVREVSPDGRLLAYSVDTTGDEVYALRFRDLTADRDLTDADDLDDVVPRTYYGGAWSKDSGTFFYTVHDRTYRPYQVWRHRIGTPVAADALVFTEDDARYEVTVRGTRSGAFVLIETACRDTSETWLIPAADPTAAPAVVEPRRRGVEYRVDHGDDRLYIVTNDGAEEFRLMAAPVATPSRPHWIELRPGRSDERLHACHVFAGHLVLELRRAGFGLLRIVDRHTGAEREVHPEIPAGRLVLHPLAGENAGLEYTADALTVRIDSLIEPPRWYDVHLATGERTLRKARAVPGYDPTRYRTERRHAPAPDGTLVPVTLAWRADTPLDGSAPCVMWGYGAYESCDDPSYDEGLACLLDRGVVYALTHPRGGGEMGRRWWLDGRLADKVNTFRDHIAVADWLAGASPVDPARIVDGTRIGTRGLSAGGLLQAAVTAMRPDRWRAVVAEVPFVDVVNTMLDPSIPLTVNEWDEWGDPREPQAFAALRAYSPYDNVVDGGRRPALLVTAAVHDPRVMVHEPAKWVARMRASASAGDGVLLLRTELGAGAHTGPAGRYAHYRYECDVYAFLLGQLRPATVDAPGPSPSPPG
jgi:oligopeptidase B